MLPWYKRILIIVAIVLPLAAPALATEAKPEVSTINFVGPWSRGSYFSELLLLGLQKTIDSHGPFELKAHSRMSNLRAMTSVEEQKYPNAIVASSVDKQIAGFKNLEFVDFPIFLGMMGYRVCYVPESRLQDIQPESLEALKQFKVGIVKTWPDLDVLTHNKIKLELAPTKESLYRMTSLGRLDLFCRGIIEITNEEALRKGLANLHLDTTFSVYYDLPFFFYTHKDHKGLMQRVEQGLISAYNDGSLKEIWDRYFKESINLVNFENRKILVLENPNMNLGEKPYRFKQYFYKAKPAE